MHTLVALLRGINVGGAHPLPMKELVRIMEGLGCQRAKTYIQSGNVVFQYADKKSANLGRQISAEIKKHRGFEPLVLLLTAKELANAIVGNPFPEAESNPTALAVGFLAAVPKSPDLKAMEGLKMKTERFVLKNRCYYLLAPEGFGRSKLASRAEKLLGVPMTVRNWRTICRISEMTKVFE